MKKRRKKLKRKLKNKKNKFQLLNHLQLKQRHQLLLKLQQQSQRKLKLKQLLHNLLARQLKSLNSQHRLLQRQGLCHQQKIKSRPSRSLSLRKFPRPQNLSKLVPLPLHRLKRPNKKLARQNQVVSNSLHSPLPRNETLVSEHEG